MCAFTPTLPTSTTPPSAHAPSAPPRSRASRRSWSGGGATRSTRSWPTARAPTSRRRRRARRNMALERKKTLNVFREASQAWGSYDDYPVGPRGTDPMPHLSRNRVAQPFFVVCAEDQVVIQMAGVGHIEFREIEPAILSLSPGDTVYVPAGVPKIGRAHV